MLCLSTCALPFPFPLADLIEPKPSDEEQIPLRSIREALPAICAAESEQQRVCLPVEDSQMEARSKLSTDIDQVTDVRMGWLHGLTDDQLKETAPTFAGFAAGRQRCCHHSW